MLTPENINILVNIALGIIMFGLGLSLSFADFKNLFKVPKPIIIGYLSQIILLPVISFSLAYLSNLPDAMKVGLVIIAICPVGTSSSLIIHLFKGNVALSLSLTVINSLTAPFTIPIFTNLALFFFMKQSADISLSMLDSIIHIGLNIIVPALLGIIVRQYFLEFALKSEKKLKYILTLILLLVFSLKIFFGGDENTAGLTFSEVLYIAPFVLGLNIIGMYSGFLVAKIFNLELKNKITVAIEVGLHNTALALVVAGTMLKNYEMEKPILVYAMFTFFTAMIFAWYYSKPLK